MADPIFVLNGAKYELSTTDATKTGLYPLDLYAEVTGFPSKHILIAIRNYFYKIETINFLKVFLGKN